MQSGLILRVTVSENALRPAGKPGKPHVLVRVRVGQGARVRVDQWGAG